jgi:hypothetical protein
MQCLPKPLHKGLATGALLLPWMIWKYQNVCIFEEAQPSLLLPWLIRKYQNVCIFEEAQPSSHHLMARIKEEVALWAQAGAIGIRAALLATWNVH